MPGLCAGHFSDILRPCQYERRASTISDNRSAPTFPAIDISRSGTRKEELITDPQLLKKMYVLRRILNPMGTMDAIDFLLDKLRNTKNNSEFFDSMNT